MFTFYDLLCREKIEFRITHWKFYNRQADNPG